MNGGVILGTIDGANAEIDEEIGSENVFLFGAHAKEVPVLRAARRAFKPCIEFTRVLGMLKSGYFGNTDIFVPLAEALEGDQDFYLLANDFPQYLAAQAEVDRAYVDRDRWTRMSILNTAGSGKFSSDRTIREYAEDIWGIEPCVRPM